MKAVVIKVARNPQHPEAPAEYPGWIVPDTEDLLAIDLRVPACIEYQERADWYVTHIPTGHGVRRTPYTDADTRERAVEVARNFFRECRARGWDIGSTDPQAMPKAHNAMTADDKEAFWLAVMADAPTPAPTVGAPRET